MSSPKKKKKKKKKKQIRFFSLLFFVSSSFSLDRKKEGAPPPPLQKEIMGLLTLPRLLCGDDDDGSSSNRGVSTLEDDNRENDDEEQRLMSSSSRAAAAAAASRTSSSRMRSGVFQFAIFGCAFLFFALGYVSSPTTPILSSQTSSSSSSSSPSSLNSRRGASLSFPSLGSSSSQKSGRHRFELLGGGGGKKREDEEDEDNEEDRREAKETNALDAELELEKDEHLLEHLQKSLNDNIETQEKETLKLVEMKVDEQDAEKMQEEEELTEEELGIHHNSHGEDEASNTGRIDKSSSKNIEDDGSELGFKEEDNESGMKNATSRKTTTTTTFEDSLLTNVSSELDEVIRDGKQSMIEGRDVTPRAAAFESMDDELKDVLDAVHAVDGSGGENSENKRNNVKLAREKVLSSSSSSSSSFDRGDRKITTPKDNPEETLGWTEVDATTIDPESITESAQSGVRSLVLNPEIVHELKEKFEDMKNKGEVQVEGNWKKFDAEAKEEKKQMKEAKKMEEIVEESSKILDDIDAVRIDAGGGSKSFSWTFSYLYFPLIVFFSVLLAVIALLIKTSDKNKLKRYGSTGSFDRSSPKRKGKSRLYTLGEEEEIYQTTKDNTYPDFSNLRDFEKGNRIYNSSIESFDDDYEDDDYDDDSLDDEEDGSCEDDFDEEALSERSSDVSSFQGFREKAIAVAKAAEEFLANGKGATVRVSNAGTFHGASKYGANENARDEKDDVGVTSLKKKESHNNNENGQKSSFIKSSTTKWI